jgi:predicted transposase/invertase (TIGR01784 family)
MIFINPKTDIAFKKIFGSEQSKDILISFLNSMLYDSQPVIEDLEILNPYLAPRIRGVKATYLDIKAKITGNKTVIVEMQVLNVAGFEKRILYNAAKSYSIQLKAGEDYTLLNPVIALTIVDFPMFTELDPVISRFVLKEKDYLIDYLIYDLELVFVELPKFTKELDQLETLTDKWLYFMKNGRTLQTVPEIMSTVPEIEQAFSIANQANLSPEELEELEKQEMFIHDQRNAIVKAVSTAVSKAVNDREREIAKGLLNLLDEEAIAQTTGLSLEEVQKLKQQGSNSPSLGEDEV